MNTIEVHQFQKFVSSTIDVRRFEAPYSIERPSDMAAHLARLTIPNDGQEHVFVVAADAHCRPLAVGIVSTGTVDMCLLSPRDIFAWALTIPRTRFVAVAHNHPSGDVTPSGPDGSGTAVVASAGKVLGLDLLWSLVVTHASDKWVEVPLPKGKQPKKQGDDAEPKRPEPEPEDDSDTPDDQSGEDDAPDEAPEQPDELPEESGIESDEQGERPAQANTAQSEVTVDELRASVRKVFGLK